MLGNYMVCVLCTNTSIQSNSDERQPHQLQQCTIEIFWHLWGKGGYKNVFQYLNPSLIFSLQSCCVNIVFYFLKVVYISFIILPYVFYFALCFFILPYVFLFCPMFFLFLKIYCKDIIYILLQTMNMDTLSLDFIDLPTKCTSLSDEDKLNRCFWWFC